MNLQILLIYAYSTEVTVISNLQMLTHLQYLTFKVMCLYNNCQNYVIPASSIALIIFSGLSPAVTEMSVLR